MKLFKNILPILLITFTVFAGDIFWEGDADTDWSNGDNWYGGSVPGTGDRAYFHGDSADGACATDADFNIGSLYMDVSYDQTFDDGGYACTTATGFEFGGGSVAGTFTGDWVITGTGNATFATGMTYDTDAMDLFCHGPLDSIFNTSGALIAVHGFSACDDASDVTVLRLTQYLSCSTATLGAGTLKWHGNNSRVFMYFAGANDFSVHADHTMAYAAGSPRLYIYADGVTLNLPALTIAGILPYIYGQNGGNISQQGALSNNSNWFIRSFDGTDVTWTTNNHNITSTTGYIYIQPVDGDITLNQGSSTLAGRYVQAGYSGDSLFWNMQTGTVNTQGLFNIVNDEVVVDAGTSTLNIGTGYAYGGNITSRGNTFYDVNVNTTGTHTLVDVFSSRTLTIVAGNFDENGQTITTVGSQSYTAGSGKTLTLDADHTMTGDGDYAIAGDGSVSGTGVLDLVLQGTGDLSETISGILTISSLSCAATDKTTTMTAGAITLDKSGVPLVLNGGTLVIDNGATLNVHRSTAGDIVTVNSSTVTNNGSFKLAFNSASTVATIPTLTVGGTGTYYSLVAGAGSTIQHTGAFSTSNTTNVSATSASAVYDFNGQNFDVTEAVDLALGVDDVLAGFTIKLKGTALDLAGGIETTTYNDADTEIQADSGTIDVAGDFALGSNTEWTHGTEVVKFDGSGNQDITTGNDSLYKVYIDNSGAGTITLQDNLYVVDSMWIGGSSSLDMNTNDLIVNSGFDYESTDAFVVSGDARFMSTWEMNPAGSITESNGSFYFDIDNVDISMGSGFDMPSCTLNGDANISGSGTFVRLVPQDWDTLTFESESTYVITNMDSANWNKTSVLGSVADVACSLDVPSPLWMNNMNIKDCALISGDTIHVDSDNSIDGGNTFGWIFNSVSAAIATTFYKIFSTIYRACK
jgi:hypothetical protein